jgi:hypothetical protein
MKLALIASAAIALAVLPATAARAQLTNVHFNLGAGASIPNSDFGNAHDIGYNLVVGLGVPQRGSPLGLRIEGIYNEFAVSGAGDLKSHTGGVTANATYDFPLGLVRPGSSGNALYAIGGVGYFSTKLFDEGSRTDFGWNLGGGFRFPLTGFAAYVEARYYSISNANVKFTPITFGLVF